MEGAIRQRALGSVVKVSAFGAAPFNARRLPRPLWSSCCCGAPVAGPLRGPSVLHVKGLDAEAHVVLERRVSHRHAILAPLQSPFVDGLHRIHGPAGQVSAMNRRCAALKSYCRQ